MFSIFFLIGAFFAGMWALYCLIRILMHAFQHEVLKGFLCLLCQFYLIYYAIFEFKDKDKKDILMGLVVGTLVCGLLKSWA